MKSSSRKFIVIAASIAALATGASLHAVPVSYTFNLSGSSALSTSKTFTSVPAGVSVDVTADAWNGFNFIGAKVGQYSGGLGVTNSWEDGSGDSHTLDSRNQIDYMVFKFSPSVDVNKISIGYEGYDDSDFRWWLNNTGLKPTTGGTQVLSGGIGTYDINVSPTSEYIYLIVAGDRDNTGGDYNGLKISTLSVSKEPVNAPGVPDGGSTALLLGAALAGLGLATRRNKRA